MQVKFVQIVTVDDYHEIEYIAQSFPALDLSSRELGVTQMNGMKYVGVIFEGNCPGDGEIADLLQEAGITLNDG